MAHRNDSRTWHSSASRWAVALVSAVLVLWSTGCAHRPHGRYVVDRVDIERVIEPGVDLDESREDVPDSVIEDKIATAASPRFFGIFPRGVVLEYEFFDRHVFERDLARIARVYRAKGFYEAQVRAGRVERTGEGHVRVTVVVREGPRVNVGEVRFEEVTMLPIDDHTAMFPAVNRLVRPGRAFDEEKFDEAKLKLVSALADRGYAFASVKGSANVDLGRHVADVTFTVNPGRTARLGPIVITGLEGLPEEPVRRALELSEGELFSESKLDSARNAVLGLGVFADVEVAPKLDDPASGVVPVVVHVTPSELREVKLGGGIELDTLRADLHLLTGWENRNFLGGLRRLTLDLRPGVGLYPTRIPSNGASFQLPERYLLTTRARAELRQPGFIEGRTQGILQAQFNMYPVIFPPDESNTAPSEWVLGYRDLSTAVGLDRRFGPVTTSLSYNFQTNFPFAYVFQSSFPYAAIRDVPLRAVPPPEIPKVEFKKVVVSYVDLRTTLDLRDDSLKPHKGFLISNDFQFAGVPVTPNFRGERENTLFPFDFRVQPDVRGYVPIRKWTLAMRATAGFLFPADYGGSFQRGGDIDPDDAQLIFFRGFFSGGPSSNRGYPFRGVGSKGPTPFFIPGISPIQDPAQVAAWCRDPNPENAYRRELLGCNFPTGGQTLWEASIELRVPLALEGDLVGAVFCDASDVSRYRLDIRLLYPHLSCGVGAHYNTPVGPIRLDVGFPIPGLQALARSASDAEKYPDHYFAVSIGIGEAF